MMSRATHKTFDSVQARHASQSIHTLDIEKKQQLAKGGECMVVVSVDIVCDVVILNLYTVHSFYTRFILLPARHFTVLAINIGKL